MPKILIADDNLEMAETLERIYKFYGFDVEKVFNGKEAVKRAQEIRPDLILLDAKMPVMDGFEACKILKSKQQTMDIPIIFLTASYTDPEQRVKGLELGADDYLLKPFNSKELVTRSNSIIKRSEILNLLKTNNESLSAKNTKIQSELKDILEQTDTFDGDSLIEPLTGLYSFNFFQRRLKEEVRRANRYKTELSLVAVRINYLAELGELYGRQLKNYLTLKLGNGLLTKTRSTDIISFFPDVSFYIILPETDKQGAFLEAERIRLTLLAVDFKDDDLLDTLIPAKQKLTELKQLTFNLGVASMPETREEQYSAANLLKEVKEALRISIHSGTDKTISSSKND